MIQLTANPILYHIIKTGRWNKALSGDNVSQIEVTGKKMTNVNVKS